MASSSYAVNFSGLLTEQGEQQVFSFDGVIGDRIFFDGIDADPVFENISYSLIDPSGATIFTNFGHTAGTTPATLTLSGTYQIVIRGDASTTGDYNFSLLKPNQAPILPLGATITDALTPGIKSNVYRLNGTRGQRFQFDSLLAPPTSTTWVLWGPNNQPLNSTGTSSGTDFSVTLPADGEYYLIFNGTNATASVSYSFQVNDISDPPPASPTAFPFSQSGSVSGSPVDFTFTAAAGTLIYFDSLDQDGDAVSVNILDPGGSSVGSDNASNDSVRVLPRSGTYTVRLTGTGDFNFRLLDLAANATALTLGSTVTETVTPTSGARIFSFAGAVGQRLFYDALEQDFDSVQAFLIGPSGNSLTSLFFVNSSSDSDIFTLSESGTYYLVQQSTAQSATDFSFQLLQAPATDLAFDTVTSSTLAPFETELYRFTGTAGQRLVFDSQSPSAFGANVFLRGPNGEAITSGNLASDFEITLTRSGSHILYIDSTSTSSIPYSFQLVTPTTTSTPLTLGSAVNGSIGEPGEQDVYTFSGTAGQRLLLDATVNNSRTLFATLRSPSGALVINFADTDFDSSLVTLTETGTYQLSIEGQVGSATSTGNYNLQLIDAAAAPVLTLDTETTGTLTPGAASAFYRFTAAGGQRFAFDNITGTGPFVRVFDAGNTQIAGGSLGFDFEFTTPEAGTYLLQIEGNSNTTTPVSYSFQLVTPTTTSTPLTLGSVVSGSIGELGEQDIYTVTGTAGQRLFFDATVNNTRSILATLRSPSGTSLSFLDADSDGTLITLTEPGTYQLIVEGQVGNPNSTGDYDFKLIDASNATLITLGTAITGTLSPGRESDFYRISGTAGQRLTFDSLAAATGANWRLFDPSNVTVAGASVGAGTDFTAFLDATGTYLLQIDGSSASDVSYNFNVTGTIDPPPAAPTAFPFSQSGTVSGAPVDFTITAAAGKLLYVDSLDPDFDSVSLQILDQGNGNATIYSTNASFDSSAGLVLPRSGGYTVRVNGSGDYNFRILDLSASATPLTLGSATSGPLAAAASQIFSFNGSAGQRLYFDALEEDSDNINLLLLRPDGTSVLGGSGEADSFPTFSLTETGIYHLLLVNNATTAADFNFALRDVATATALPFDTVTNGSLSPGQETDLFRFTGTAGQRLVFDSQTAGFPNATWRVIGPANQSVANQNISTDLELNLTADGTYVLAIDGSSTTTVNYGFSLITPSTTTTALSLNSPVSSSLSEIGERDIYTFTGTAGQRLYYDALTSDFTRSFPVRLIDPTGDIGLLNQQHYFDSNTPFTLTET
ncbi:beta strand repeat-containing protein, partial [Cyanobium sp. N5-Cardenillas]|uniref:beta strand repeat-containing protein n=1 Tax=Cyanobium sp. N5-Cardenillas TaxID=2823720 RepID=UPI0020CDE16E